VRRALVLVILIAIAMSVRSSAQTTTTGRFVPGEILVKFRPGAAADTRGAAHRAAGATLVDEITRTRVQRVRVRPGDEAATIARYQRNPNVLYAELNFVRTVPATTEPVSTPVTLPGDSHFGEQWGMNNTGQSFYCIPWIAGDLCFFSGTPGADIDAPEAWAISKGSPTITVGVIDTGIDYTHPDLSANYAGGDDFTSPDGDPMDDHGHGTHVAGIIAAALDNLTGVPGTPEGVAGVAPNTRVRAYKVCLADGTCDDFAVEQAITRAASDGVKVINMSLGGSDYSDSLNDAVQDAWNAGVVIVAGAGNDGTTAPFYPAALDNVVSVGAFDEDDARASFSNYGSWVDISAPGNYVLSTYPMAQCDGSTTPGDVGCYQYLSGTSMATPFVAGAAALVWSRSDVTSNQQVVDILLNSAEGKGVSAARLDSWTIHGGLNLHNAILYGLSNLPPVADAGPDQTVTDTNNDGTENVTLNGSGSSDHDGTIASYTWKEAGATIAVGATPSVWLAVGTHTITLEVTDDGGATASDTVVITVERANRVTITAPTSQATEAGPTSGTFLISRTGDTSAPLTVRYSVSGTAGAGTDYVSLPVSATIAAGAVSATITVTPIDDLFVESNETVVLTLLADAAYSVGSPNQATVTIVSDDLPPDLTVSALTVPAVGAADLDFVVTDTTTNKGTGTSPVSKTGFYLSVNTFLDASDMFVGSRTVASLAPSAADSQSTTLHVPPSLASGSYYVLAKADYDDALTESNESNNLKAAGVIRIGPDLVITAVTAPTSAVAGGSITISETTKNQGAGSAAASITRFYLSLNTLVEPTDIVLGGRSIGVLAAGSSSAANTLVTLPANTPAGTYYVIAAADAAGTVGETTENNNTKLSALVKVGADLVVMQVDAPSNAGPGTTVSVTDSTKNQGAGSAPPSSTGFYLSTNLVVDAGDVFLGSVAVGELASGVTQAGSLSVTIPGGTAAGTYYIVGKADWDGNVAEASETNNDRASGPMKVGADMVVTAVTASTIASRGGSISVSDTTANQSATPAPESTTAFYLSTDFSYSPTADVFLGSRLVPALQPNATSTASTPLTIPGGTAAGTYYVLAVADWGASVVEGNEANNTRNSGAVRIGADLFVAAVSGPSSAAAGSSITVGDTTSNQGGDIAAASSTSFYLSVNTVVDANDVLLGSRALPPVAIGASNTGTVTLPVPASTPAGSYFIIAVADGGNAVGEAAENNNTRAKSISITAVP